MFRMAVTASNVYKFNAEKLRQICSHKGLDNEGPIRLLQQRLLRHFSGTGMASKQATYTEQASARRDLSLDATRFGPQEHFVVSHVLGYGNLVPIIVELLRPARLSLLKKLLPFGVNEFRWLTMENFWVVHCLCSANLYCDFSENIY